ncbi:Uncharacterised protein [Chryseobacterium nakagawai]|uniref:YD repeat-containing protein n=1 Tax=Chryseobacterium nakagawai TaxID=1241982 RepID=A0AAD0YML2_CHRNA|nr:hypothetical protein [Chryseobacterium nakagawai]AZA89986.1 hypothetical protein EG343_04770 [Chryseobacterium nakagawai]VEH21411.1 Uncharacterised protein [Chryseobacterium nakagawai]
MKKIILLLLLIGTLGKAQLIGDEQTKQVVPLPASAESYSLSKVEAIPMDYFRGKANINIPIYTINVNGISIPISLAYNTGGIKLNEVATTVGLGWSLSIPGTISHNVVGLDDLDVPFFKKNIAEYGAYSGTITESYMNNQIRADLESIYGGTYDTQKDIFDYNLPTASGSFLLKENNQTFLIPNDDVVITRNDGKFYIKDTQGIEYWMSPRNLVMPEGMGGPTVAHKTLYNLDELKVNSKSILFSYNKNNSYTERNINQVANFKISSKPGGNFQDLTRLPRYEKTEASTSFSESLISKISFDNGEINFLYSNDTNAAFSDGSSYRKDLSGGLGVALRRIIVTNKAGVIVKDISLNYSYFETDNANKTYEDYRLKLLGVRDNLQNTEYSFEYNEKYKLPKRSSSNDDYWGYINSIYNGEVPNIPNKVYDYDVPLAEMGAISTRNRESNEEYAVLGTLTSIKYPTGAKKNFYYELPYNTVKESIGDADGYLGIGELKTRREEDGFDDTKTFPVTSAHIQQIINLGINATPRKLQIDFWNSCENAKNPPGSPETIAETACWGFAQTGSKTFSQYRPGTIDWEIPVGQDLMLNLFKIGKCNCSIYGKIRYSYPIYTDKTKKYGSPRIRKIEDIDANNVSNVYEYAYGKYSNGVFIPDFQLKQKYNFSSFIKRQIKEYSGGTEIGYAFEKYYRLHNSSQGNTSYGSSDVINYPSVVEITDKGKIIREYEISSSSNYVYNKWKGGRLKREIYLNKANDTLKVIKNTYQLNTLKNSLSEFTTNVPKIAAFSTDFDIAKGTAIVMDVPVEIYAVEQKMYMIESAKIEHVETTTKEFFGNKSILTKTLNAYWDTDVNKPFNVKSTENILPSGENIKTEYQYAHQAGNQLLIDRNMIAIPLETATTKTANGVSNIVSKSKTIFPTSLPISQTGFLVLPTSVLSYDLQNPNQGSTELSYDKYDSKGNIVQYTNRAGVSTVIIWGYNQTQPIAKIENAKLEGIGQPFIDSIVNASNLDAAAERNNDETNLHNAFKDFRNNLSGYQITTYSYDPLIGVRSITPPSGIREVYLYDAAGRLKEVREHNNTGKLLKEFNYHYKN